MPYKSKAQAAYFHAHEKEMEQQGVDVAEWDKSSKGKKLPEKVEEDKKEAYAKYAQIYINAVSEKLADMAVPDVLKDAFKKEDAADAKKLKVEVVPNPKLIMPSMKAMIDEGKGDLLNR